MEADQFGRLYDILEATRLIAAYVKDTTVAGFHVDMQKQDAVIRRIEIIGEAAAHVSEATRREIPELPFRRMRGMRNIVAHDYANVGKRTWSGWGCTLLPAPSTHPGVIGCNGSPITARVRRLPRLPSRPVTGRRG